MYILKTFLGDVKNLCHAKMYNENRAEGLILQK